MIQREKILKAWEGNNINCFANVYIGIIKWDIADKDCLLLENTSQYLWLWAVLKIMFKIDVVLNVNNIILLISSVSKYLLCFSFARLLIRYSLWSKISIVLAFLFSFKISGVLRSQEGIDCILSKLPVFT